MSFPSNDTSESRVSFNCQGTETKLGLCTPILQMDLCDRHRPFEDAGVGCGSMARPVAKIKYRFQCSGY